MVLMEVKQLSKTFGGRKVIDELNFNLKTGHSIALIGANGAGKTTTLRLLNGLIKKSTGEITFKGQESDFRSAIGYLPQHPVFPYWLTGEEYLSYIGKLQKLPKHKRLAKIENLLKLTGIYQAKDKRIQKYSGGMKQRLGIAQALINQPELLILDEPVSALDPVGRREILTLMEDLKTNTTVLFSTHILTDAEEVCDDVILMDQGKIIEAGTLKTLKEKYQNTMIELEFYGDAEIYIKTLQALPSVIAIHQARQTLHISVTHVSTAKQVILQKIVNEKWELKSFKINEASLEDMFMKAVNG